MEKSFEEKSWESFQKTGLLWFVNRSLHLFGWAIVIEVDKESNRIQKVYPQKTSFRGFNRETEEEGFSKVTNYLKENIESISAEVENK